LSEKTLNVVSRKCRAIVHQAVGVPILFLHGFSYTSSVWQRISVTELLLEKHVPFLALDMPYGQKSECSPKTRVDEVNVAFAKEAFLNVFSGAEPFVVGASIGGHVALKYAALHPVKGLLLVAPSRTQQDDLTTVYGKFKFPVRIIWGSEDNIISGEEMRTLADQLPNCRLVTYEGAGHSAYLAQPDRFKRDLLEVYAAAEQPN
jgi:pimeloyl-ACP methyl ester carboxylesterase